MQSQFLKAYTNVGMQVHITYFDNVLQINSQEFCLVRLLAVSFDVLRKVDVIWKDHIIVANNQMSKHSYNLSSDKFINSNQWLLTTIQTKMPFATQSKRTLIDLVP